MKVSNLTVDSDASPECAELGRPPHASGAERGDNRGCKLPALSSAVVLGLVELEIYTRSSSASVLSSTTTAIMPVTNFSHPDPYTYQTGFDSYHEYDLQNGP